MQLLLRLEPARMARTTRQAHGSDYSVAACFAHNRALVSHQALTVQSEADTEWVAKPCSLKQCTPSQKRSIPPNHSSGCARRRPRTALHDRAHRHHRRKD